MEIALITSTFLPKVGGVEWKVHFLATEYSRHGHGVTVYASRPQVTFKPIPLPIDPSYKVVRYGFPVPGIGGLGISKRLLYHAIQQQHALKPLDVLHCHHLGRPTEFGVFVKKYMGIPVVATTCGHDVQMLPEINYGSRQSPRFDRIVRNNLKRVDVVGSISRSIRSELEDMDTTARIVDIPNGVSWDDFQSGPSNLLRERLGLDERALLVLSVGRNHVIKGYELGIRAFAKVARRHNHVYYAIVGKDVEKLSSLVTELEMKSRIRLVPQVPMVEMPQIFNSADIFFNPSLTEGFAQVNAQALACGLPCVLTDAPGNCDAGQDGGAIIARTADPESMAEALEGLVIDKSERIRLGLEAHRASRRYSWENIARQYLDVFKDLVSSKGSELR